MACIAAACFSAFIFPFSVFCFCSSLPRFWGRYLLVIAIDSQFTFFGVRLFQGTKVIHSILSVCARLG